MQREELTEEDLAVDGKNRLLFKIYKYIITEDRSYLTYDDFLKVLTLLKEGTCENRHYTNALERRMTPTIIAHSSLTGRPIYDWRSREELRNGCSNNVFKPLIKWYNNLGTTSEQRREAAKRENNEIQFNAFLYMLSQVGHHVKYLTDGEIHRMSSIEYANYVNYMNNIGYHIPYPRPLKDTVNNSFVIDGQRTMMMKLFGNIGERLESRTKKLEEIATDKIFQQILEQGEKTRKYNNSLEQQAVDESNANYIPPPKEHANFLKKYIGEEKEQKGGKKKQKRRTIRKNIAKRRTKKHY